MSKHWNPRSVHGSRAPRRSPVRRRALQQGRSGVSLAMLAALFLGLVYIQANGSGSAEPSREEAGAGRAWTSADVDVVDGDTFRYRGETVRIADIDTPEIDARCAAEAELAGDAARRLGALLAERRFELEPIGRDEDRYGRKLRIVTRDGRSIGERLIDEGLARKWEGRRMPWCSQGALAAR